MSSSLTDLNPSYQKHEGIYLATSSVSGLPSVMPNQLSSYLEIAVPKLFESVTELSLFSFELESSLDTPELKHAFNAARHNLLRVADFNSLPSTKCALSVATDFGGSAEYLAGIFDRIDAFNQCIGNTKLSAQRNRSHDNINHYCVDLPKIQFPQDHYDFIYVGEIGELSLQLHDIVELLQHLLAALNSTGILVFSSRNTERLSRLMQNESDDVFEKTPYSTLYNTETDNRFSQASLRDFLEHNNRYSAKIHASYSAAGDVNNLLSSEYLARPSTALNHFYRIGSVQNSALCEYLAYKNRNNEGHDLLSLASGFNVILGHEDKHIEAFYNNDFTHFPGRSRRPHWRAITAKPAGLDRVTKTHTLPEYSRDSTLLQQDTSPQTFSTGRILIADWLQALLAKDSSNFNSLVKDYYSWLKEQEDGGQMPSNTYDLMPFNLLVDDHGAYHSIDPEWQLKTPFDARFVLFRALFWFAFENRSLLAGFAERGSFINVETFVRNFLINDGVAISDSDFSKFIALEETIQAEISHFFNAGSIELSMKQPLTNGRDTLSQPTSKVRFEATWSNHRDEFLHELTQHAHWQSSNEKQRIQFQLPPSSDTHPVLRLDPIDNQGLFVLHSIALLNSAQETLWQIDGEQIAARAELRNAIHNEIDQNDVASFTALNDDPFLLFDLTDVVKRAEITTATVELSLPFDPNYHASTQALKSLVNEQAASLRQLSNKGHERQADIDTLNARLAQSEAQRAQLEGKLMHFEHVEQENSLLKQRLNASLSHRALGFVKRMIGR